MELEGSLGQGSMFPGTCGYYADGWCQPRDPTQAAPERLAGSGLGHEDLPGGSREAVGVAGLAVLCALEIADRGQR